MKIILTILHSERPKLYIILAFLRVVVLKLDLKSILSIAAEWDMMN